MATDAQFDTDLEAALAASAAEAREQNDRLRIDKELPWLARSSGFCVQRNLLNQFHAFWQPAIEKHSAASSICGYMTIAIVRLLRSLLTRVPRTRPLTLAECSRVGEALMATPESMLHEVERAMSNIHRKRAAYIDAHRAEFDAASAQRYLRAWVANYEVSDELRESLDVELAAIPLPALFLDSAPADAPVSTEAAACVQGEPPHVHFARFNEFVNVNEATHEERERILAEQSRFGGTIDEAGITHFGEGESDVILERLGQWPLPRLELLNPAEWRDAERADGQDAGAPRVWAVDTSGHFYAALSCRVFVGKHLNGSATDDLAVERTARGETAHCGITEADMILAFNTTMGSYLGWPMIGLLHGHVFGSTPCELCSEQWSDALEDLAAMGFEADAARDALAQAGGRLSSAVELLVRSSGS